MGHKEITLEGLAQDLQRLQRQIKILKRATETEWFYCSSCEKDIPGRPYGWQDEVKDNWTTSIPLCGDCYEDQANGLHKRCEC